jgi:hypothetical protein
MYSFLGGIMMFLVSTTIRAEKRGSVGDAVIVRMGVYWDVFVGEWLHGRARKDWPQSRERSTRGTRQRIRWRHRWVLGLMTTGLLSVGAVAIYTVLTPANASWRQSISPAMEGQLKRYSLENSTEDKAKSVECVATDVPRT